MKFSIAPIKAVGGLTLAAYQSEGGTWQIQVNPTVMGSARLNVWHARRPIEYLTAYCLGYDQWARLAITGMVRKFMETLPEDFHPDVFRELMPEHTTVLEHGQPRQLRPIDTDPALVIKLAALAGLEPHEAANMANLICEGEGT